ncbi:MAG TPA: TolC family protein, partial [Anaerolineae bacterium]|nr:TolC family protein [Anaerolineae bacterium]
NEVLMAQLRITQTEMELVSRQADLEKAEAAFRNIVDLDYNEEVIIEWNDEQLYEDISPDIQKAFDMRPEFKAFDAALETARQSILEARAGKRPSLGLFSAFNYGKPGLDLPANEWMTYFSGGVSLNWNIWDWGTSARNTEKALLNRKKTIKYREEFKGDIEQQFSEALAEHTAAKKRSQLSKQAAGVAENRLKQITSAYREGMATEIDYDNAHASFTRATLEESVSEAALWLTKIRLEYVLGIRYTGGHNE